MLPRFTINRRDVDCFYMVRLFRVRRRLCDTDFSQPRRSMPRSIADPLWTLTRHTRDTAVGVPDMISTDMAVVSPLVCPGILGGSRVCKDRQARDTVSHLHHITELGPRKPLAHKGYLGTPGRTRTSSLRIRSPLLYPIELRGLIRWCMNPPVERVTGVEPA
jgi:hypothetical protein